MAKDQTAKSSIFGNDLKKVDIQSGKVLVNRIRELWYYEGLVKPSQEEEEHQPQISAED